MKTFVCCLLAALLGTVLAWGQEPEAPRPPPGADDGIEVLTRGAVHEAFAGTIAFNPEPGIVVPKVPRRDTACRGESTRPDDAPEACRTTAIEALAAARGAA